VAPDVWATIAAEAASESSLWAGALRPADEREAAPVFSPLADKHHALGLETIYEGYLLHYGRSRLFEPDDRNAGILLGDYLYAHGLVRIAALGDVRVVLDLAELISLCSQLRAEPAGPGGADAEAWAATAAALGHANGRLEAARAALRDRGDPVLLARLAREEAGPAAVADALRLHAERVL
jgi:hypothetical protein